MPPKKNDPILWKQPDGSPVSCIDKLKVLTENLEMIEQECQDAFEDAILMSCDEAQVRDVLENIIKNLKNPYKK